MGPSLQIVFTGTSSGVNEGEGRPSSTQQFFSTVAASSTLTTAPLSKGTRSSSSNPALPDLTPTNPSIVAAASKAASTSSVSASASSSKTSTPIGPIVGGIVGGVAVIAGLAALCLLGRRKGWFSKDRNYNNTFAHNSPSTHLTAQPIAQGAAQHGPGLGGFDHSLPVAKERFDEKGLPIMVTGKPAAAKKTTAVGGKKSSGAKKTLGAQKKPKTVL